MSEKKKKKTGAVSIGACLTVSKMIKLVYFSFHLQLFVFILCLLHKNLSLCFEKNLIHLCILMQEKERERVCV